MSIIIPKKFAVEKNNRKNHKQIIFTVLYKKVLRNSIVYYIFAENFKIYLIFLLDMDIFNARNNVLLWKCFLILGFSMTMWSCSDDDPVEEMLPEIEDEAVLRVDYAHSLADAQNPDASKVSTTLMPISDTNKDLEWKTIDGKRMVLVCTMMNHSSLRFWEATDTFRLSKQTGIWVTLPADWKRRANEYARGDSLHTRYRMIQMLGLWPGCDYDTVVEFYVDASRLFRPAFDPSINTTTCGTSFPAWADENYTVGETNFREWFAYQSSTAYVGDYACPWTQLGYTYDWHHGSSREGLSEFVATYNSLALIKKRQGSWTFINKEVR